MTKPMIHPKTVALLVGIGFVLKNDELRMPNGDPINRFNTAPIEKIAGRASNIGYMARTMDMIDQIPAPAEGQHGGDRQFRHLVEHIPTAALIYFALRRLQRDGKLHELRKGLTLLIAFEEQQIDSADVLTALYPEGHGETLNRLYLPIPTKYLRLVTATASNDR